MDVRRSWWSGICSVVCLNGAVILAEDAKPDPPDPAPREIVVQLGVQGTGSTGSPAGAGGVVVMTEGGPLQPQAQPQVQVRHVINSVTHAEYAESQGKYWIGLRCNPPHDALRTQLDLAADVGLLVEEVTDGGPAKKAGIQVYDLLLAATIPSKGTSAVRSLKSATDLVEAVQAAETGTIRLDFLRRGRKQSLELIPEVRPKQPAQSLHVIRGLQHPSHVYGLRWAGPLVVRMDAPPPLPEGMSMVFQPAEGQPEKVTVKQGDQTWEAKITELDTLPEEIRGLVGQQLAVRNAGRVTRGFSAATAGVPAFVAQPGVTVGTSGTLSLPAPGVPAVPEGVTVTVVRKGSDPARISIRKGDQTWDVTDKELDQLPAELRPVAESVLAGRPTAIRATIARPITVPAPPQTVKAAAPTIAFPTTSRPGIELEMKQLIEQVERLRRREEVETRRLQKEIDSLRQAVEKSQPGQ